MSRIAKTMKKEIQVQLIKKITFEEKVRSMTAKEIIMSMVDGLKNPTTKIDMDTYGSLRKERLLGIIPYNVCYACAATNTICKISGIKFSKKSIDSLRGRSKEVDSTLDFLYDFERAIDFLRLGRIEGYNSYAKQAGFSTIRVPRQLYLPELLNHNYKENLHFYEDLAKLQ